MDLSWRRRQGCGVTIPRNEDRPGSPRSDNHYEAAGTERKSSTSPKRTLRNTDTLVGALAAEVGSVVWVGSRTRLSAARDSES